MKSAGLSEVILKPSSFDVIRVAIARPWQILTLKMTIREVLQCTGKSWCPPDGIKTCLCNRNVAIAVMMILKSTTQKLGVGFIGIRHQIRYVPFGDRNYRQ
jgi:hypothetical protein